MNPGIALFFICVGVVSIFTQISESRKGKEVQ